MGQQTDPVPVSTRRTCRRCAKDWWSVGSPASGEECAADSPPAVRRRSHIQDGDWRQCRMKPMGPSPCSRSPPCSGIASRVGQRNTEHLQRDQADEQQPGHGHPTGKPACLGSATRRHGIQGADSCGLPGGSNGRRQRSAHRAQAREQNAPGAQRRIVGGQFQADLAGSTAIPNRPEVRLASQIKPEQHTFDDDDGRDVGFAQAATARRRSNCCQAVHLYSHAERCVNDEQRRQQGDARGGQCLRANDFGGGAVVDFGFDVRERLQFDGRLCGGQIGLPTALNRSAGSCSDLSTRPA